ncbi:MAG: hypothetical protein IJO24_00115 [Clostridia bacterium]|nr:hypothetical protein [Clostridia bacterium]
MELVNDKEKAPGFSETDKLINHLVDGIAGKESEIPTEKETETRRRLAGRAWEYLMFADDED